MCAGAVRRPKSLSSWTSWSDARRTAERHAREEPEVDTHDRRARRAASARFEFGLRFASELRSALRFPRKRRSGASDWWDQPDGAPAARDAVAAPWLRPAVAARRKKKKKQKPQRFQRPPRTRLVPTLPWAFPISFSIFSLRETNDRGRDFGNCCPKSALFPVCTESRGLLNPPGGLRLASPPAALRPIGIPR